MPSVDVAYPKQIDDHASDHWSGPPVLVDRLASSAGTRPGHVVVDVGCGVGGPARQLRHRGCDVVALDAVHRLVVETMRRARGRVRALTADASALPLRDGVVDQVWGLGVVAHLQDARRFGAEARRVLRSGGTLVLTDAFWVGRRRPRFQRSAPRPWWPLRVRTLAADLADVGLTARVLPWPALDVPGALAAGDPMLGSDLADGRLRPAAVIAVAAG